jgi:hypothetical protein
MATFARIGATPNTVLNRAELAAAGHFFTRYLHPDHGEALQRMQRRWRRLCRFGCSPGIAKADIYRETLMQLT